MNARTPESSRLIKTSEILFEERNSAARRRMELPGFHVSHQGVGTNHAPIIPAPQPREEIHAEGRDFILALFAEMDKQITKT